MSHFSTALKAANFAFNPFSGLRPDWGLGRRIFIQAMAAPLLAAGLLPADHPTTRKKFILDDDGERIGAAQLLRDSLRACPALWQLRTWRDLHQFLVWVAVALGWSSIWLTLVGWLAYSLAGTAQAQSIAQAVAESAAGTDLASQWLRGVFGVTAGVPDMQAVQSGLGGMLKIYNAMVMLLGVYLSMYHVVAWVMDRARTGKFERPGHSTSWSIVRLVVAMGFSVPVAGFNASQLAVLWLAGEGSHWANSSWTEFVNFVAGGKGMIVTPPLTREYEQVLGTALATETCFAAWNNVAAKSGDQPYVVVNLNRQLSVPWSKVVTGIERSYDGSTTSRYPRAMCGTQIFVPPENKGDVGAQQMTAAQRDALVAVLPDVQALARRIVLSVDADPTVRAANPQPPTRDFRAISDRYAASLAAKVAGAVAAQDAQAREEIKTETRTAGWLLAPAWMSTFARLNGSLIEEASKAPKVTGPAVEPTWPDLEVQAAIRQAEMYWHTAMSDAGRPHFRSTAVATSQTAMDEIFGKFGFAEVVQGFMLSSNDPLAELTAFGHRIINWSLGIFAAALAISGAAGAASAVPGIGIVAKGAVAMAQFASPLLSALVAILLVAGTTLAVVLPWIMAVRWMLATTSWLVSLLEAMLGLPLMLLAMLGTEGTGLLGAGGRNGAFMLATIFVRPIMMVICLVGSYGIFMQAIKLWNLLFVPMMSSLQGGSSQGLIIATAHVVLYTSTAWAVANVVFKSIDTIPSIAVRWMGGHAMADMDATSGATNPVNKGAESIGNAGQRGHDGVNKPSGAGGDKEMHRPPKQRTEDMIAKAD